MPRNGSREYLVLADDNNLRDGTCYQKSYCTKYRVKNVICLLFDHKEDKYSEKQFRYDIDNCDVFHLFNALKKPLWEEHITRHREVREPQKQAMLSE